MLRDGRQTDADIAEETGIAKAAVHNAVEEMKNAEIIKGATTHINYRGFGYQAVANLLIYVDPKQTDRLTEYIKKMDDIYALYSHGPKGNIRVVATLRTLQQLDKVKDEIRRHFTIFSMRSVIWTDVKEMHQNLGVAEQKEAEMGRRQTSTLKKKSLLAQREKTEIDEIDLRIADLLSKDGLSPFSKIAQETGISSGSVKKRYAKLKENGLLKVTIQIDPTRIGYFAMAIFYLTFTMQEDTSSIIGKIGRIPDVISIMKTSGDYDLQVYVMIKDINQLLAIQDNLSQIEGIAKIDTDLTRSLDKWPTPRQYISTFQ